MSIVKFPTELEIEQPIRCPLPEPNILLLGVGTEFERVDVVEPLCCPEHLMNYKLHCLHHEWDGICNLDESVFDDRFRETNIQPCPVKFFYVLDDFQNDVLYRWIDRQSE